MPKELSRQQRKSKVFKSNYFLIEARGGDSKRVGKRGEFKSNNSVGKKKETDKVVGLGAVGLWINLKFLDAVRDDPFRGLKKSGSLGHIPSGVFEGIDDEFPFEVFHRSFKGERRDCARTLSRLKGRWKMIAVDDSIRAEQDGSLNTVLEFPYVPWPMVLHEHVNGWS